MGNFLINLNNILNLTVMFNTSDQIRIFAIDFEAVCAIGLTVFLYKNCMFFLFCFLEIVKCSFGFMNYYTGFNLTNT